MDYPLYDRVNNMQAGITREQGAHSVWLGMTTMRDLLSYALRYGEDNDQTVRNL